MTEKKVTILLPTYNEANNIAPLLRALNVALSDTDHAYEILIIDDSSDNTPQVVEHLMKIYPEVRIIHRPKSERTGLATAFVRGFAEARGKYILCMDSDLQHPPAVVPRLIESIEESDSDIIVATRYLPGGGADGLGTIYRKLVSKWSRLASWLILPVTRKTTDPGSGFFVVTAELVRSIPFDGLRGFKILIDILTRAPLARVGEVPYVFRKRENEESKATFKQGIEFLRHILYLRSDEDIYNPKGATQRDIHGLNGEARPLSLWLTDAIFLALIIGTGWFVVGYLTNYNYLLTSYEDWIYHAFRVETLQNDGITSWNHEWGTGMNIWRLYQYGQHHLVLWATALTGVAIPKMLIYFGVGMYIGIRIMLYILLRFLGVAPLFALLGVTASFTFVQEWIAMQDFSIYVAFTCVPVYLFLWIRAFANLKLIYILSAVTGCLWSLHPLMGFSMSILLAFLVLFSPLKGDIKKLVIMALVYFLGATPFLSQYLTAGYYFSNPLFSSPIYLSYSVLPVYGGLSLSYWVLFGVSWFLLLFQSSKIDVWVKVLLVYCSFYLVLIYLGQNYFLPEFIVQFQFSRGISALALLLAVCFGVIFYQAMKNVRSWFLLSIVVVFVGINIVQAVATGSGYYVAPPVNTIENPVAKYFETSPIPEGSIFYENISEASYFTKPGVRFVTSYNEHLQPHPYSTRLNILIKNSTIFTGISESHLRNAEDYATVLGIEYYFLASKSPFVKGLTEKENALFEQVAEVQSVTLSDSVTVLRSKAPVSYGYIAERSALPTEILSGDIPKPNLYVATYQPWDEEISKMAEIIRSGVLRPLPLTFQDTDRLSLAVTNEIVAEYDDPVILIHQSYDQNWRVENVSGVSIAPTELRMMVLTLSEETRIDDGVITLKNSWPWWHWKAQAVGPSTILILVILYGIRKQIFKK